MTQVFEMEPEGVAAEMADLLEDIAKRAEAGAVEGMVDNIPIKKAQTSSMVKYNGIELPARTPVYDRDGEISLVPTAALAYHLSKQRADSPGERASVHRRDGAAGLLRRAAELGQGLVAARGVDAGAGRPRGDRRAAAVGDRAGSAGRDRGGAG
jgi:hypothetical protein